MLEVSEFNGRFSPSSASAYVHRPDARTRTPRRNAVAARPRRARAGRPVPRPPRRRAPARPAAASRRTRSPGLGGCDRSPRAACRRGRAASRASPSRSGSPVRARRGAGTRRSRRRPNLPSRRSTRVRAERARAACDANASIVVPAPDVGEQDEEERCRVDGAVVAGEEGARSLTGPELVHDLARLGVDRGIVLGRLQPRELAQRGVREVLPSRSVCRLAMIVSRPKTVMNHGSPAAISSPLSLAAQP